MRKLRYVDPIFEKIHIFGSKSFKGFSDLFFSAPGRVLMPNVFQSGAQRESKRDPKSRKYRIKAPSISDTPYIAFV